MLRLTIEQHMQELRELRDSAACLNQLTAAINAERLRGKSRGPLTGSSRVSRPSSAA